VAQDLDRARAAIGIADTARLALRLDEAMRQVDGLPLLVEAAARGSTRVRAAPSAPGSLPGAAPAPGPAASAPAATAGDGSPAPATGEADAGWRDVLAQRWQAVSATVWQEVRTLVRVSRIEQPEALLLAPEQAFFVRENLKLRLLNARLALLSRQFDTAQADLREAQEALARWFDPAARPVGALRETLQQVSVQARQVTVPRPEASLSAIGSAMVGR
jgi:uroporphyrin-3 C-methyltransferase